MLERDGGDDPAALALLIELCEADGRHVDAIPLMQRYVRRYPSSPEAAVYRERLR